MTTVDFNNLPAQPEARKQVLLRLHENKQLNREFLPLNGGNDWHLLADAVAKKLNIDVPTAMVRVYKEAPFTMHRLGQMADFSAASKQPMTREEEKALCKAAHILAKERNIDFTDALDELLPEEDSVSATKADFSMNTRADELKLRDEARKLMSTENIDFSTALDRLLPE